MLGQGLAEHEHLDGAAEIVECGEHHRIAGASADALGLDDDPADGHPVLVAAVRERRQLAVCARAQSLAQRLERVRGHEQPDRLLLDGEQLRLLELLDRDRRVGRTSERRARAAGAPRSRPPNPSITSPPHPARVARSAPGQVEDRALADLGVLLSLLARGLGLLEHARACPCDSLRWSRARRT